MVHAKAADSKTANSGAAAKVQRTCNIHGTFHSNLDAVLHGCTAWHASSCLDSCGGLLPAACLSAHGKPEGDDSSLYQCLLLVCIKTHSSTPFGK
jgi:hypothetical protein